MFRHSIYLNAFGLSCVLLMFPLGAAQATAMYEDQFSRHTSISVDGVLKPTTEIPNNFFLTQTVLFSTPNFASIGWADVAGNAKKGIEAGADVLNLEVWGSSDKDNKLSMATSAALIQFSADNKTDQNVSLSFDLKLDWSLYSKVDDADSEWAWAEAAFFYRADSSPWTELLDQNSQNGDHNGKRSFSLKWATPEVKAGKTATWDFIFGVLGEAISKDPKPKEPWTNFVYAPPRVFTVPEPSTILLVSLGLVGITRLRR